ncbi:hypothetical protein [Bacillus sp. FJAT-27264]|uniref:hypothetical protein n=1 Tax=Paenibacillus sp. (strain DSM 101736 / FJAT-27264) TaxID=1850362 RepID=UPI001112C187|nr:hypothetical protein [Bacillus sp. FJAT-27264]
MGKSYQTKNKGGKTALTYLEAKVKKVLIISFILFLLSGCTQGNNSSVNLVPKEERHFIQSKDYADDSLPGDKEMFIINKHFKQLNGSILYTIEFTNVDGANIEFSVPETIEKIATLIQQKTIKQKADSTIYEFSIEIPNNYLAEKRLDGLSFELRADQISTHSRKTIFHSFIPVTIDEFNSKAP